MKISANDHRIIRQCAKDQAKRWVGASKVSSIEIATVDGNGLFYLYVYTDDGLACNIQAEFDEQGLLAVHADIDNNIWKINA